MNGDPFNFAHERARDERCIPLGELLIKTNLILGYRELFSYQQCELLDATLQMSCILYLSLTNSSYETKPSSMALMISAYDDRLTKRLHLINVAIYHLLRVPPNVRKVRRSDP